MSIIRYQYDICNLVVLRDVVVPRKSWWYVDIIMSVRIETSQRTSSLKSATWSSGAAGPGSVARLPGSSSTIACFDVPSKLKALLSSGNGTLIVVPG